MKPYFSTKNGKLYNGDCLEVMQEMSDNSVDNCITSPPYYGLRDYGVDGQIGLEDTPDAYVERLVVLFREIRRVMADDGTLWLNLGDSYNGNKKGNTETRKNPNVVTSDFEKKLWGGAKTKDLIGIPWRVAFALQTDGWYLRQDIIWHKPNPMPESVTDRCTKAHEYIFLLSKRKHYYFDYEAIKEKAVCGQDLGILRSKKQAICNHPSITKRQKENIDSKTAGDGHRNRRSVWTVNPKPYKEAHFATYPEGLILPCVKTTKPNAVILDPFMGAGTTAVVAEKQGRRWVGTELNPTYCEIAAKRIEKASKQHQLFDGVK